MLEQLPIQIVTGCRMWPKSVGNSDIAETTSVCFGNELPITRSVPLCDYISILRKSFAVGAIATKVQIYGSYP